MPFLLFFIWILQLNSVCAFIPSGIWENFTYLFTYPCEKTCDTTVSTCVDGVCLVIHSSKFIFHSEAADALTKDSIVLRKVLDASIEDDDKLTPTKPLQNYAAALKGVGLAKKGEKIKLLEGVPNLCTKDNNGDCLGYPSLRVYTDNDDTVKCSGSESASGMDYYIASVAGSDESCISSAYYVGVRAFYHELSTKTGEKNNAKPYTKDKGVRAFKPKETGENKNANRRVSVVSANPDPHAYVKNTRMNALVNGHYIAGNWLASIAGAVDHGQHKGELFLLAIPALALVRTAWVWANKMITGEPYIFKSWVQAATVKANSLYSAVEANPTLKKNIVWVGDDGQGDALTAVMVAAIVRVSFIHRVSNDTTNQQWLENKKEAVKLYDKEHVKNMKNIVYFNTYPEAAELAMQLGLITSDAAMRIHEASLNSALGRACCDEKECVITSELNKNDNTCGTEVIHGDVVYAADADGKKTLKWNLSKYCAPVRDAWGYWSDKEGTKGIKCSKGGPSGTLIKK